MAKTGRPSSYTEEVATEICALLAEGNSLSAICRRKDMPALRTVYFWIETNEQFLQSYTRAREAQADTDADTISDIAQRVASGKMDPAAARVAIDAYKWTAGKRKPTVYGDRLNLGGNVGLTINISKDDADL